MTLWIYLFLLTASPLQIDCEAAFERSVEEGVLDLDFAAFDQDLDGGWRTLASMGCDAQAALLLDRFIAENEPSPSERVILKFHAGQSYAFAGDESTAAQRISQSLYADSVIETREKPFADRLLSWNAYVNATLAFLRKDADALKRHRQEMAAHADLRINQVNLKVVDRFIRHFDGSYKQAYTGKVPEDPR